jgi:glucose/arabinose dehydrogenase
LATLRHHLPMRAPRTSLRTLALGVTCAVSLAMSAAGAPLAAAAPPSGSVGAISMFSTGGITVAGMAIAKDGRVFYVGPQNAKIFVWSPVTKKVTTFATIPNAADVYGVAVSPQFATNHFLYTYASVAVGAAQHEVLARFTDTNNVGTSYTPLRDVGAEGTDHTGGKILFGPAGKNILLVVGDGGSPANSQNPAIDHGKILRLTPTGTPANGNPGFADKAVYATGIRNSIGMANDPKTGNLWETENGPECNDELNRVIAGGNYGWGPAEKCDGTAHGTNQDGTNPIQPAENISTVVAPVGATFCNSCGIPAAQSTLVCGRYLTDDLRSVTLDSARTGVVSDDLLYQDSSNLLAVESSPADGSIWFADGTNTVKRLAPNLVSNPSFETNLAGWGSHNGTLTRFQPTAHPAPGGGTFAVHTAWAATTSYTLGDNTTSSLTPTVPSAPAGATYTASAYVRAGTNSPSAVGKPIHLVLREKTPQGGIVRDTSGPTVSLSNTWQQIAATATVLTGGDSIGMRVQQDSAAQGNSFDADVMVLVKAS